MILLNSTSADIEQAAAVLAKGGIVAFPTETVYGLGADAFNTTALARVFEAKGRPRFDPLIVHIASLDTMERLVRLDEFDTRRRELLRLLVDSFWPGPLTLVLPKRAEVPDLATAGLSTVAVRFPSNTIAQQLITLSTGAVAAPSANRFGRLSPSRAGHVVESLGDSVDCIIDGGPCSVGVESTVLELFPFPRILRFGGISREQLEEVIGPLAAAVDNAAEYAAPSPGMLSSHYAPRIPLYLHSREEMAALPFNSKNSYLFFSGTSRDVWLRRTSRDASG
jgi:L-threonylcarbamoyladenylate synthase